MEEELNHLMKEKIDNEKRATQEFESRVKESKKKAISENVKKAKETGNKLTQMVDDDGNLMGVNNTMESVFDSKEEVSVSDIRNELFNGDDVRTKFKDEQRKKMEEDHMLNSASNDIMVNINNDDTTGDTTDDTTSDTTD